VPLEHGDSNRLFAARHDGLDDLWVTERRRITLFLQLEALFVDAGCRVQRQHQLEIDSLVGSPRRAEQQHKEQKRNDLVDTEAQPTREHGADVGHGGGYHLRKITWIASTASMPLRGKARPLPLRTKNNHMRSPSPQPDVGAAGLFSRNEKHVSIVD